MANLVARPETLQDHLEIQLHELDLDETLRLMAERIISSLDSNGYLQGALEDLLPPDYLALAGDRRDELRVLHTTEAVPRNVVCVRDGLDPQVVGAIKRALLEMHLSDDGQAALDDFEETARFHRFPRGAEEDLALIVTLLPHVQEDLRFQGSVPELKAQLGDGSLLTLQGEFSDSQAQDLLARIDGLHFLEMSEERALLSLEKGSQSVGAVLEQLYGSGLHLTDVNIKEPNLEDLFIKLTGRELRD